MPQVRLVISGRVQGVFFRMHAHKTATALKLTGWVRNTGDGCVEAFAEGPREKLEEFADWCRRGTPAASVENIDIEWSEAESRFGDFRITD